MREISAAAEKFRRAVHLFLMPERFESLPNVPSAKTEAAQLLRRRLGGDDMQAVGQSAESGSECAGVIAALRPADNLARRAFSILSGNSAAQLTLAPALGGSRFRVIGLGRLAPMRFGRCRAALDSFGRLIKCYSLAGSSKNGEQAVEFLVAVATKRKLVPTGASAPFSWWRLDARGEGGGALGAFGYWAWGRAYIRSHYPRRLFA